MFAPLLTEKDPKDSAEGSIDPLGIYSIADSLAVRMIPGVRERQQHPRFLTTMAVSLSLCSEFPEETVATDGVSEPWQVFEWYCVEGLVRTTREKSLLRGLPGQDKAASAIAEEIPLSAKRYLKTPTVFGMNGVYRTLAREIDLERADRLGEMGYQLVKAWEQEQGLDGFLGTGSGPGKQWRKVLLEAIQDGLEKGAVARMNWGGWKFFSTHLGIYEARPKEAQVIAQALLDPSSGFRREVFGFLIGENGRSLWEKEMAADTWSERRFHSGLREVAGPDLKELLAAIEAYESFCRLLQDAFDDVLESLSKPQRKVPPSLLAQLPGVERAAQRIPDIFGEVGEHLAPFDQESRFRESFGSLSEPLSEIGWVERLLEHHRQIQKSKPPEGKAPWFDTFDDGTVMIRTAYVRDEGGRHDDSYVHAYRTASLWSFAKDLRLVNS